MSKDDSYNRVIATLKRIPERKFSITELASQLIDEKGNPDVIKVMDRQPDVNLALSELQAYVRDVKDTGRMLVSIGKHQPWDYEDADADETEEDG